MRKSGLSGRLSWQMILSDMPWCNLKRFDLNELLRVTISVINIYNCSWWELTVNYFTVFSIHLSYSKKKPFPRNTIIALGNRVVYFHLGPRLFLKMLFHQLDRSLPSKKKRDSKWNRFYHNSPVLFMNRLSLMIRLWKCHQ